MHAQLTHASKDERPSVEALLDEPSIPIPGQEVEGAPSWWGSDEDAWESFMTAEARNRMG